MSVEKEGRIVNIQKKDEFDALVSGSNLSVIHFWAPWATQCEPMDEAMKILAEDEPDLKNVNFARVEAEEMADISMDFEVAAVPTFLFFKSGKILKRIEGAKAADVTKAVKSLASQKSSGSARPQAKSAAEETVSRQETPDELNARLKKLINSSPVMLFMKGDPTAPKCGFSRQTIEMFSSLNAKYGTFDILSDDAVRQGLKTYSDWPTYPQLYIKGEFIGGLDILKEMNEGGELKPMMDGALPAEPDYKALINRAPLMIFMKGNRDEPRCGFSRTLIGILNETGLDYETFDIFSDEDVRQGLKKFSNWPTYPQVYVKGDLVGGLDIIKELQESDELISTLKGE